MTSPGVSLRGLILTSTLIIGWIIGLSYLLSFLYGARPTGSWLVVGIMISGVIFGSWLMTRDLFSNVEKAKPDWHIFRRNSKSPGAQAPPEESQGKHLCDRRLSARCYRVVLGLSDGRPSANRRKVGLLGRSQAGFRPVTLRFNPV
jgi:hypothetical protein